MCQLIMIMLLLVLIIVIELRPNLNRLRGPMTKYE
jgi:hypothetical protein